MVEMQLSRLVIRETREYQSVYLREKGGTREFQIVIGYFEARAIDRKVRKRTMPRPMTHDLLASVVSSLGASLDRVVVSRLERNTFFAHLDLTTGDGEHVEVDARPSDALALAAHCDAPIFVAEDVLASAGTSE